MMLETKCCNLCGVQKPLSEFHKSKQHAAGVFYWCKECAASKHKEWWPKYAADKTRKQRMASKQKEWREKNARRCLDNSFKRRYGISVDQYDAMLVEQKGLCGICSKPSREGRRLSVDHCHKTKVVRGLLCHVCNQGIGYFYDDPELLTLAANYLRSSRSKS